MPGLEVAMAAASVLGSIASASGGAPPNSATAGDFSNAIQHLWWGTGEDAPPLYETEPDTEDIGYGLRHSAFYQVVDTMDNNPYKQEFDPDNETRRAFDPDSILNKILGTDEIEGLLTPLDSLVSSLSNPDDVITGYSDTVEAQLTTTMENAVATAIDAVADDIIDPIVTEFESDLLKTHYPSVNRFTGGMSDINATAGSAFVIGLGLMEDGMASQVRKYRAELKHKLYSQVLSIYNSVYTLLMSGAVNILGAKINATFSDANFSFGAHSLELRAKEVESDLQLKLDVFGREFGLATLQRLANLISTAGGAATGSEGKPSTLGSVVGAAARAAEAYGMGRLLSGSNSE